ncbi:MAG: rhombosortase [Planctomycetota bacterium]
MNRQLLGGGRPGGVRLVPAIACTLAAVALTWAAGLGAPLALVPPGAGGSGWWQLWTGHFVHLDPAHLLLDAGAAAIILCRLRRLHALLWMPPLVGIGVLLSRPDLASYAGLSGVLHGLAVLQAFELAAEPGASRRRRAAAYGLGAIVILKAVAETVLDTRLFTAGIGLSGVPVGEAHLTGALCGLAAEMLGRLSMHRAAKKPAIGPNTTAVV